MSTRLWILAAVPVSIWLLSSAISGASEDAAAAAPAAPGAPATAAAPGATPQFAFPQAVTDGGALPVLNHWFALGSGCRARDDVPGDVSVDILPQDPSRPNVYRARVHLDKLRLASDALPPNGPVNFAKECAIRLNINPPPGLRVVNYTAQTSVVESKDTSVKLTIASELKIGNKTLGRELNVYDKFRALSSNHDAVSISPGATPGQEFPDLACAEPKILGFDYTWIAERTAATDEVSVELGGDKTLLLEAELAACP